MKKLSNFALGLMNKFKKELVIGLLICMVIPPVFAFGQEVYYDVMLRNAESSNKRSADNWAKSRKTLADAQSDERKKAYDQGDSLCEIVEAKHMAKEKITNTVIEQKCDAKEDRASIADFYLAQGK